MSKYTVYYIKHQRFCVDIDAESLQEAIEIAEEGAFDGRLEEIEDSISWEVDSGTTERFN